MIMIRTGLSAYKADPWEGLRWIALKGFLDIYGSVSIIPRR
jgi:hypothetical protein